MRYICDSEKQYDIKYGQHYQEIPQRVRGKLRKMYPKKKKKMFSAPVSSFLEILFGLNSLRERRPGEQLGKR